MHLRKPHLALMLESHVKGSAQLQNLKNSRHYCLYGAELRLAKISSAGRLAQAGFRAAS